MLRYAFSFAAIAFLGSSCAPAFLNKYRQEEIRNSQNKAATQPAQAAGGRRLSPAITQVGEGVFRVPMTYDRAWDALVDVLLRNYNLQIAERNTGLLTTEWDSYYLEGKVHRNKVSIRLKRIGNQGVELTLHNNVEVLSRLSDGVSDVWLPSERTKPEIGRIIQNLAIQTNQPKPTLTAEYQPTGEAPKPSNQQ